MAADASVLNTIANAWSAAQSAQAAAESYAAQAVSAATVFLSDYGQEYRLSLEKDAQYDTDLSKLLSDIASETTGTLRDSIPDAYRAVIRDAIGRVQVYGMYGESGSGENAVEMVSGLARSFNSRFNFSGESSEMINFLTQDLTSAPYGLPAHIEEQMRARAIDALDKQITVSEDEAISAMAARGFPIPSAVITRAVFENQQKALEARSGVVRDVFINQAERAERATQFYVQAFDSLQKTVTSNFQAYINSIISARSDMEDTVQVITDAIVKLRGSVIASYGFAVQERDLLLRQAVEEGRLTMEQRKIDLENFKTTAENTANAALAAAKTMGDLAAAAVGSQNTMATIAYETIAQDAGG